MSARGNATQRGGTDERRTTSERTQPSRDPTRFLFLDTGSFKLGGTLDFGARVVPWETGLDADDYGATLVDLVALVGVDFGY
ncbi:MAG: hypothetical protein HY905_22510 [Deltaproteobacteria bacterium]|nr:hypothetical protein [Deltaproteobacteria bacterium]